MGWLTDVYRAARRAYRRNVWARHWCRCYLEASDPATAFATYEPLASTVDSRAWLWLRPELDDMPPAVWLRAHWDMNLKRLEDISKASQNELKDKLFATRTMAARKRHGCERFKHPITLSVSDEGPNLIACVNGV
jgi:hypothetical protein